MDEDEDEDEEDSEFRPPQIGQKQHKGEKTGKADKKHHRRHHWSRYLRCVKKYIIFYTVLSLVSVALYVNLWRLFVKSLHHKKGGRKALRQTIEDLLARVQRLEQQVPAYHQAPIVHSINSVN
jgi:hypothetical protein